MTPRILLLASPLDGTGPGRVMATLAAELQAREIPVLLVATHGPRSSPLVDEMRAAAVPVDHLGMQAMWDPAGVARLLGLVRRFRPTVVHTRTIRADVVGRAARAAGVPLLANIVNLYPDDSLTMHGRRLGRAVFGLARATGRAVSLWVANSENVARNVRDAFRAPEDRVRVVLDGIPLERWRDAAPADRVGLGVGGPGPLCVTSARLHPQKRLEDLVDAAAIVRRSRPDARFLVVGEGPLRGALEDRARAAGLGDGFVLAGWRDDLPAVLAAADLFVLSSAFEGLPAAVIEAMACGLPVVATAVGGVPELVDDGRTGLLVPPCAPAVLAKAILECLSRGDAEAMGAAGRARAERALSSAAMAEGFLRCYAELA